MGRFRILNLTGKDRAQITAPCSFRFSRLSLMSAVFLETEDTTGALDAVIRRQ